MSQHFVYYLVILVALNILTIFVESYQTYTTEDPDLCSPIKKGKIKITKNSAIIVKQTRLQDHSLAWEKNFLCKFQLYTTNEKEGIFAVIQNLELRQEDTEECIDYVQFRATHGRNNQENGKMSRKYCGSISTETHMGGSLNVLSQQNLSSPAAPNAFIDPKGTLDVEIFISKEKLQQGEETDLNIVFTTYRDCRRSSDEYQPCGDNYRNFCIIKSLIKDDHVNCPFSGCTDEEQCSGNHYKREKTPNMHSSIGNKVLLGSVATLMLMFGIFITCLWICKHYNKFCWSGDFANPVQNGGPNNDQQSVADPPGIILQEPPHVYATSTPSSPITDPTKDLPPSYDSLFPDR